MEPTVDEIIEDLKQRAALGSSYAPAASSSGLSPTNAQQDSLIGLIQAFRPDGLPSGTLLAEVGGGELVCERLDRLFEAVASSERPDSMKDAYFIVRDAPRLTIAEIERVAVDFVAALTDVLSGLQSTSLPATRVLEGKPPKHPKAEREKCSLLKLLQGPLPVWFDRCFCPESLGHRLAEPFYFVACDSLLRDYLRWPLRDFGETADASIDYKVVDELLHDYFTLWSNGVKYRIFGDEQIDFYVPR